MVVVVAFTPWRLSKLQAILSTRCRRNSWASSCSRRRWLDCWFERLRSRDRIGSMSTTKTKAMVKSKQYVRYLLGHLSDFPLHIGTTPPGWTASSRFAQLVYCSLRMGLQLTHLLAKQTLAVVHLSALPKISPNLSEVFEKNGRFDRLQALICPPPYPVNLKGKRDVTIATTKQSGHENTRTHRAVSRHKHCSVVRPRSIGRLEE